MGRRQDKQQLEIIAQTIEQYPGRKPGWFARLLGMDNKAIMRALPQLEDNGYLLLEDDQGRVSLFGHRRR